MLANQTFKEFVNEIIDNNRRVIFLIILFCLSIGIGLEVWYSLEAGIIKAYCNFSNCYEVDIKDKKGEFYAWVISHASIAIAVFAYWIYLLINKSPNNQLQSTQKTRD